MRSILTGLFVSLSIPFAFAALTAPAHAGEQVVNLNCLGPETWEHHTQYQETVYSGLFLLTQQSGDATYRGYKVNFLDDGPEFAVCGSPNDFAADSKFMNAFNAKGCADKEIYLFADKDEMELVCAPGSQVTFHPTVQGAVSGTLTKGPACLLRGENEEKVQLNQESTPPLETRAQLGRYNACDHFQKPISN